MHSHSTLLRDLVQLLRNVSSLDPATQTLLRGRLVRKLDAALGNVERVAREPVRDTAGRSRQQRRPDGHLAIKLARKEALRRLVSRVESGVRRNLLHERDNVSAHDALAEAPVAPHLRNGLSQREVPGTAVLPLHPDLEHLHRRGEDSVRGTGHSSGKRNLRDRQVGVRRDDAASGAVGGEEERVDGSDSEKGRGLRLAAHTASLN